MILKKIRLSKYLIYLILGLLIYIPVFGFLNVLPIRLWDESRLAVNSLEMYLNHNFLVPTFNNEVEMWSTKPPLMIWLQVLFINIVGIGELAIRLPSAFAAFFTILLIIIISEKHLKSTLLGFIWVLVLTTSHGYINIHATRTGDYDALLTLFSFGYILSFYFYSIYSKNKYLYLGFIALTLAVLTKGIAGMFFTPVTFMYLIFSLKKDFLKLFRNKHFYFGIAIFLFFGIGYYLLREMYNPGYLKTVNDNELGGRFLKVNEQHQHEFWYYFHNFINFQIKYWYLYVIPGIILSIANKNNKTSNFSLYIFINALFFFLIISIAKTKLEWYDVPLYPLLTFFIAFFIYFIIKNIKELSFIKETLKYKEAITIIVIFLFFINPYSYIINKTYKPVEYPWAKKRYEIGYFLQDAVKGEIDLNNVKFFESKYYAQNLYYIKVLQLNGINIKDVKFEDIKVNDKILVPRDYDIKKVENKFNLQTIFSSHNINIYKVLSEK